MNHEDYLQDTSQRALSSKMYNVVWIIESIDQSLASDGSLVNDR